MSDWREPLRRQGHEDVDVRLQRALRWLEDAIDATGCDRDELVQMPGNEWIYVICALDELRGVLVVMDETNVELSA